MGGMGGGMGGMGLSLEQTQAAGGALLNAAAASDQSRELRIADKEAATATTSRDGPSVAFPISRARSPFHPGAIRNCSRSPACNCLPTTSPRPHRF